MAPALMSPVVAHRGASATAPENTVAALREAALTGARWAEIDVRLTACGDLVVIHDARLERTTDGFGEVASMEAAAITVCDAGAWFAPAYRGEPVPRLAQVLDASAALGLGLNVEIKAESPRAAAAAGLAVARRMATWPGPVVVSSFAREALTAARGAVRELPLGLLVRRTITADDLAFAAMINAASLHADHRAFEPTSVARVQASGLWTAAYTVNDPMRAQHLWSLGVGSVITDDPRALLEHAPTRS